jgi:NTP pyrophosphatase (non-canonical NTP hydrolase)
MDNKTYKESIKQFIKPSVSEDLNYFILGLGAEVGEVQNEYKKKIRDGKNISDTLPDELGDVLFYLTMCADLLDLSLEDLAELNFNKLSKRHGGVK